MPKLAPAKIKSLISLTAIVALVIQTVVPGGLFSWPAGRALAATQDWGFTSASDYTIGSSASVIDSYAILDLNLTASGDSMDLAYGATTDLIETSTAGTILAAVDTVDKTPYSTDYGSTWSLASGTAPDSGNLRFKYSNVATLPARIMAVGRNNTAALGASWYTTDNGTNWTISNTIANSTKITAVVNFPVGGTQVVIGTSGAGGGDGQAYFDPNGGDLPWVVSTMPLEMSTLPTAINDFVISKAGAQLVASVTWSPGAGLVPIMYSKNGGTWTVATTVSGNSSVTGAVSLATDPVSGNMYATTNGNYILKSTDNGASWSEIAVSGSANAKVIYVDAKGGVIVIKNSTIWRCLDSGTDFAQQTTTVPNSPSDTDGFIRMSDYAYLLGVTVAGTGDAYTGAYIALPETGTNYTVTNKTGVAFTEVSAFSDSYADTSEASDIQYQISNDGTTWSYWDGSNWNPASSSANSNTAANINTNISFFDNDVGTGTFYFRAYLDLPNTKTYSDTADNSLALDSVSITYVNEPGGGGGGGVTDEEPPISQVVGILDDNGRLVSMPSLIYKSAFTIVAEAHDNVGVEQVELLFARSKPSQFNSWGRGIKDSPTPGYWSWSFDSKNRQKGGKGDGTYYFYSLATDKANNPEFIPKKSWLFGQQYDAKTTINTKLPYIEQTMPYNGETKVGVKSSITVWFSQDMNRNSVESAFYLLSGQGGDGSAHGTDLGWSFDWRKPDPNMGGWGMPQNRWVTIKHSTPFNYSTAYTALINPSIAKDLNGLPLDDSGTQGVPNPWHFTTDGPQDPDLSNSYKNVLIYDQNTSLPKDTATPGDYLYYTVAIINSSSTVADLTTLLDKIPDHTKYVDGSLRVRYLSGVWIQMAPPPPPRESRFNAWYEESDDGTIGNGQIRGQGSIVTGKSVFVDFMVKIDAPLANGTVITNTAEINDGVNPTHYKSVSVTVKASSNWANSYKEAQNNNSSRTPGTAKVGDTLTYTIYVENSGDMDATDVVVTDQVPAYTSITGSPTGGLVYNPTTNSLTWSGAIAAGQSQTFTFQVHVDSQPPNDKITNTTAITDEVGQYVIVKEVTIVPDGGIPYIVPPTQPKGGEKSVKLFTPIVITFTDSINTDSLRYIVSVDTVFGPVIIYDNSKDKSWKETWSPNSGKLNAKVTIQPDKPFQSGSLYTIQVTDAIGGGKHLGRDGDVPNNTWSFTTVRPALYFVDNGILSLVAGTVSEAITVKLGDWINYDDPAATTKQFQDYTVENPDGISVKLLATSPTGKFDTDPKGKFDGSIISVSMPQGKDTITFYYTDPVVTSPTLYKLLAYNTSAGYLIYADERWVLTTDGPEERTSDQIYFRTGQQSVPAGDLSQPIEFEIRNPQGELVVIERGRQFLLETTSSTGEFYDQFRLPIDQYVTLQGDQETKTYYQLTINADTTRATFYYRDSEPGNYLITVNDQSLLVAAGASGPADSATQAITIVPIEDQELEEFLEELEDVKDETQRKLDYVTIDPTETTLLPGGVRTFKAEGFDTTGKAIPELKFSWYVISGGGTILKKGLSKDNHASVFTAGKIPGVYADTVLVATMYNGDIQAALASVTVADVVNYGGPGELPSTGPNGIQLLFIALTLLSAVALAGVEHYEKTHFEEGAQPAK